MNKLSLHDRLDYDQNVHYQTRAVRWTLRRLGLLEQAAVVRSHDPAGKLTFAGFDAAFPTYPLVVRTWEWWTEARQLAQFKQGVAAALGREFRGIAAPTPVALHPEIIARLVTMFDDSRLMQQYQNARALVSHTLNGRPFALVFPFAGVHGGWLLHEGAFQTPQRRTVIETEDSHLRLERYRHVLQAIVAGHWTPGQSQNGPAVSSAVPRLRGVAVDPWLPVPASVQRRLGTTVAAKLFTLLLQLATRQPRPADARFIRRVGGIRYVVAHEVRLAWLLGVSRRTVQEAITVLTAGNLVLVRKGLPGLGNSNGYLVPDDIVCRFADDAP